MARDRDWAMVEMACVPAPAPTWIMPGTSPRYADWSFATGRPSGCSQCRRWHAGTDLIRAKDGQVVVSPEDGTIRGLDRGWTSNTKAVYLETARHLLVFGGMKRGSHKEWSRAEGQRVSAGDSLARVLGDYGMTHFEIYERGPDRRSNSQWKVGKPPPVGLLHPLNYVQAMAGERQTLANYAQRHAALAALGYYDGIVRAPWTEGSREATKRAQDDLGLDPDGTWGPETDKAIQRAIIEGAKLFTRPCGPVTQDAQRPAPRPSTSGKVPALVVLTTLALGASAAIVWQRRRSS